MKAYQEPMKNEMHSIRSETEETIKRRVKKSWRVKQRTQVLRKELNDTDETQVELQAVKRSLDM
jgi:hypothetical protein